MENGEGIKLLKEELMIALHAHRMELLYPEEDYSTEKETEEKNFMDKIWEAAA